MRFLGDPLFPPMPLPLTFARLLPSLMVIYFSNCPSTGMRQSPWLSDLLSQNVELDTLRSPVFGSVNGFAIEGTSVVAAVDMCMLYMYENVSFPIGNATHH